MSITAHRPTARLVASALTAFLAVLCVGCSIPDVLGLPRPPTQEETMDAQAELAARPSLEDATARYDEMLRRIRDRLDTELGPLGWYEADPPSRSACGNEYNGLGAYNSSSPLWAFDGSIPDARWPQARQIVADIAAGYGFVTAGLQVDSTSAIPTAPEYRITNGVDSALDAHYRFATNVNSTLRVTSGCHRLASPTS